MNPQTFVAATPTGQVLDQRPHAAFVFINFPDNVKDRQAVGLDRTLAYTQEGIITAPTLAAAKAAAIEEISSYTGLRAYELGQDTFRQGRSYSLAPEGSEDDFEPAGDNSIAIACAVTFVIYEED